MITDIGHSGQLFAKDQATLEAIADLVTRYYEMTERDRLQQIKNWAKHICQAQNTSSTSSNAVTLVFTNEGITAITFDWNRSRNGDSTAFFQDQHLPLGIRTEFIKLDSHPHPKALEERLQKAMDEAMVTVNKYLAVYQKLAIDALEVFLYQGDEFRNLERLDQFIAGRQLHYLMDDFLVGPANLSHFRDLTNISNFPAISKAVALLINPHDEMATGLSLLDSAQAIMNLKEAKDRLGKGVDAYLGRHLNALRIQSTNLKFITSAEIDADDDAYTVFRSAMNYLWVYIAALINVSQERGLIKTGDPLLKFLKAEGDAKGGEGA